MFAFDTADSWLFLLRQIGKLISLAVPMSPRQFALSRVCRDDDGDGDCTYVAETNVSAARVGTLRFRYSFVGRAFGGNDDDDDDQRIGDLLGMKRSGSNTGSNNDSSGSEPSVFVHPGSFVLALEMDAWNRAAADRGDYVELTLMLSADQMFRHAPISGLMYILFTTSHTSLLY